MAISEKTILLCGHGSGNPSLKEMYSYLESRYNQFAPNGKRKGIVEVRRRPKTTADDRVKFHDNYKTILGRNIYNQLLRTNVYKKHTDGKYYSDCSSSGCYTYKQFTTCDNLNTAGIHSKWDKVPVEIKNGHITNPEILEVGDAVLFAGSDASRPLQIGHVEYIYQMNSTKEEFKSQPIEAMLRVTASSLNVRNAPSSSGKVVTALGKNTKIGFTEESGDWVKCSLGWVSKKYLIGWVKDKTVNRWWYCENGKYPMYCLKEIDGKDYIFDRDGWCVESSNINPDCSLKK